jgi:hypothetical protein
LRACRGSFTESIIEGVFTVPRDGDLDVRVILQSLADAGYTGWLVVEAEQDPKKAHPLTMARTAREHLRAITGLCQLASRRRSQPAAAGESAHRSSAASRVL